MVKFNVDLLKSSLRMAVSRISLAKAKRLAEIQRNREELIQDLTRGDDELARIAAQAVINKENFLAGMDMVSAMCLQCADLVRVIADQQ